jgi:hypothetical protein
MGKIRFDMFCDHDVPVVIGVGEYWVNRVWSWFKRWWILHVLVLIMSAIAPLIVKWVPQASVPLSFGHAFIIIMRCLIDSVGVGYMILSICVSM